MIEKHGLYHPWTVFQILGRKVGKIREGKLGMHYEDDEVCISRSLSGASLTPNVLSLSIVRLCTYLGGVLISSGSERSSSFDRESPSSTSSVVNVVF